MAIDDDIKEFFVSGIELIGLYRRLAVLKVIKFLGRWL